MNKGHIWLEWGYYPSNLVVYTLLYYTLNMLDFIITTVAVGNCDGVYELNPFYYHPYFALWKPLIPFFVLLLYFALYFVTKSERDRVALGRYGLGCIMMLVFVYEFICLNNIIAIYLSQS
jgi:hypothetical protein